MKSKAAPQDPTIAHGIVVSNFTTCGNDLNPIFSFDPISGVNLTPEMVIWVCLIPINQPYFHLIPFRCQFANDFGVRESTHFTSNPNNNNTVS